MPFKKLRQIDLDFLSLFKGTVALFRNPNSTDSVYDIEDGLRHSKAMQFAVKYVKADPAVAQLMQECYIAPLPNLEALRHYPPGSLGYQYAISLIEAGFDPNFYRPIAVKDDISYMLLRLRQTHDVWHIVTGFDTDIAGELGLKAFELAQTRRPMAVVLLAGGLLKALTQAPESLTDLLQQISKGYQLGLQTKPFLAQKWEEAWDKPLLQWQSELGVFNVLGDCGP